MEPSERWHPIAPATDAPAKQRPQADRQKRRRATAVACIQCRTGKAKCDGTRPRCHRCKDNDVMCQYDVAEGVSRAERMKMLKKDGVSGRMEELERIAKFLRATTDSQASNVLARLRLGDRVEDIAKTLPAASVSLGQGMSSGLSAADSLGTPGNSPGSDMAAGFNEASGSGTLRHGYTVSMANPGWQAGTSGASPDKIDSPPFLAIAYDRQDFLKAVSENEEECSSEDDDATYHGHDPTALQPFPNAETQSLPLRASAGSSRRPRRSPKRREVFRSIFETHLRSRQGIVNTINLHPNLTMSNNFGNMPLSSSMKANHYPTSIQELQVGNLALPTWCMLPINTRPAPKAMETAFNSALVQAKALMKQGTPIDQIIETHPNIAAMYDEEEFKRSGFLSQWAVSMVHSALLKGNSFTCFASMYISWYLMRWMIWPSEETYMAMPDWLRPTPNQLFMPHVNVVDFIAWPALRELVVQLPTMQDRMAWLMDLSLNLQCDFPHPVECVLARNEHTGLTDLSPLGKEAMRNLSNWSVGPSFRAYVGNADSYVRIRTDDIL